MTPELDVVLDPAFTSGLADREMGDIRAMRTRCQALENSLSFVRRLIQGRLDIVGGEMERRRDGGASGDTSELIGRLPDILSDGSRSDAGPGAVRPPQPMEPDHDVMAKLQEKLDAIASAESLGAVSEIDSDRLAAVVRELTALEDEVSHARRGIHVVIDRLQTEVTRRYASGEATVDGLLRS